MDNKERISGSNASRHKAWIGIDTNTRVHEDIGEEDILISATVTIARNT
jgi:hypothetical protein